MQDWIYRRRQMIERDLVTIAERQDLSPVFLAQNRAVVPALRAYARGKVIDVGCGTAPFAALLSSQVEAYHGFDLWPRSQRVVLAGDIQNMGMLPDAVYDTALCLEVLEHVPDPCRALAEISRILKPGGILIMTVPHLSRLHDVPHDYYRYTRFGIQVLLERNSFAVVELREKAGLFSFLGHQLSTVLVSAAWPLPLLRKPIWWANRWLVTWPCYTLDHLPGVTPLFPLGYLAVARKQAPPSNGKS